MTVSSDPVTLLNGALIDHLSEQARSHTRKRLNLNLHSSYEDPCQRLFIAIEPSSYVRPHRHLSPLRSETFLAIRGRLILLLFDDNGQLSRSMSLVGGGDPFGLEIPGGVWHSVFALDEGSVFFETKPGPYQPLSDKDWAPWAPPEDAPRAAEFLAELRCQALQRLEYGFGEKG
ncbi:MAG: cupin fold metalloprotein, WbuC family [Desulfuromonas sp.]|nr:MAG: cupin fold metalloprotein, WbuC family [Desulfuromonas sp.]